MLNYSCVYPSFTYVSNTVGSGVSGNSIICDL